MTRLVYTPQSMSDLSNIGFYIAKDNPRRAISYVRELRAQCRKITQMADKPICREVSQDWNTYISYAEDGSTVEIVLLEARASGAFPFKIEHAIAAFSLRSISSNMQ